MEFATPMAAYESTVGARRKFTLQYAGTEPGDPKKAANVLFKISRMAEPPLRLPLGVFARQYVKESYENSLQELERWSHLTLATEIEG
jgi:hypothetical protein